MTADWRDQAQPDRPNFGLGDLSEDEEITVTFLDEGRLADTRHGKALEIGVRVESVPEGYTDMNDNPVEAGEEYNLMTSSSRFMFALDQFAETLKDTTADITAEGTSFKREYFVQ